ncbi:MAG: hypothetical protein AAGD23_07145 [Pseudomonadota bacterium]
MRWIRARRLSDDWPMKYLKRIFVGLFGLVAILFLGITGYVLLLGTSEGAPTPEEQASFEIISTKELFRRSFTLADLMGGDWAFACFAGQQVSSLAELVRPFANDNDLPAAPTSAWAGDPNAAERWALVLYDDQGAETVLPMNERLVRYRKAEADAAGWCFKASGHTLIIKNSRMETVPETRPSQPTSFIQPKNLRSSHLDDDTLLFTGTTL